ncbi:hypothetical protein IQ244_22565 [Nostoc sp. LEGE 06077]|uniref:hypothetical protein n=1 Tax=Nostoc sp. LEGE 06077 TaxID=915325 RepID=UPI00187FD148|nr:hypothetical protein [Nostoc sp. LEGE 06077]MBE9209239.1 hypothetical protein [Nostoc sp. LEGE 06077]
MISLFQKHWRLLACFLAGLVVTVSISLRTPVQQPAIAAQPIHSQVVTQPQANLPPAFYAEHLEHNFYQ